MSKQVKDMIVREYQRRFDGIGEAVLVEIRGMSSTEDSAFRTRLRKHGVRVTVIRNNLAKRALGGTPLEAILPGLSGPSAIVYGRASVVSIARQLVEDAKKNEKLGLKGACIDGEWFAGKAGVERLSSFPTKEESQAQLVTLLLSPARNLVGAAKAPGARLLGIVKEIESRLEKGESIAKSVTQVG
ncbi:MAG: 50S ribosomal protein L10 [Planctomycetota bacterium]|nr:50S ribosomal protein L10 [Planctomycetota bacterium]